MKPFLSVCISTLVLTACGGADTNHDQPAKTDEKTVEQVHGGLSDAERMQKLKTTPISADVYPTLPEPNYGPLKGSITFVDTDPGDTIGGTLTMNRAVDENGNGFDEQEAGLTTYMIHWGLDVGEPGTQDDAGAGDLGGDCMGFRDTGHVVMMIAADAGDVMSWEIPQGTEVPDDAVYFVGHSLYGKLHNLAKCTQTPIVNLREN